MIHVVVGTKAQLVKMAPVMAAMKDSGIVYNYIYTGQHKETISDIQNNFNIKAPDITVYGGKEVTSILGMLSWVAQVLFFTLLNKEKIFQNDKNGVVLVHGDTFSTLLGALMGKMARLKIAHIESGLRSFNYFHPFPEELTRLAVFYLADFYFCPGEVAKKNLSRFNGEKYDTGLNTLYDSLAHVVKDIRFGEGISIPDHPYCVISTHRFENWASRDVAARNIELILNICEGMKGIFILHSITRKKLEKYNLLSSLQDNPNIELRGRYDYLKFMSLVSSSEFLVTDGGSNQEECFYMGKPCLLLRKATERVDGIGHNVVVSCYDKATIDEFVTHYRRYAKQPIQQKLSPSEIIVSKLSLFV